MGRLGGRFSVRGWGSRRGRKHDSPPAATPVGRDRHETEAEPGFSKKKSSGPAQGVFFLKIPARPGKASRDFQKKKPQARLTEFFF